MTLHVPKCSVEPVAGTENWSRGECLLLPPSRDCAYYSWGSRLHCAEKALSSVCAIQRIASTRPPGGEWRKSKIGSLTSLSGYPPIAGGIWQ
jgi:hypothetical protein